MSNTIINGDIYDAPITLSDTISTSIQSSIITLNSNSVSCSNLINNSSINSSSESGNIIINSDNFLVKSNIETHNINNDSSDSSNIIINSNSFLLEAEINFNCINNDSQNSGNLYINSNTSVIAQVNGDLNINSDINKLYNINSNIKIDGDISITGSLKFNDGSTQSSISILPTGNYINPNINVGTNGQITTISNGTLLPSGNYINPNINVGTNGQITTISNGPKLTMGNYINPNINVDTNGQITTISNGTSLSILPSGNYINPNINVGTNGQINLISNGPKLPVGNYTNTNITVDSNGQIITISNGTVSSGGSGITLPTGTYTNSTITVNSSGQISGVSSGTSGGGGTNVDENMLNFYYPSYLTTTIKTTEYHFGNNIMSITIPAKSTCLIYMNVIYYIGNMTDTVITNNNMYTLSLIYGCSNTLLSSIPYSNLSVDTSNIYTNTSILPFSYIQDVVQFNVPSQYFNLGNSFVYDNIDNTSKTIYLFAGIQGYNGTPTKIYGKLKYDILNSNNNNTALLTYNSLSSTYTSFGTTRYGVYTTLMYYNTTSYLSSIVVPANTKVLILQNFIFNINSTATTGYSEYFYYCSTSSSPATNLDTHLPVNGVSSSIANVIFQSYCIKPCNMINATSQKYLNDVHSFYYYNNTGSDITLYLHGGINYNDTIAEPSTIAGVTGCLGKYTIVSPTSYTLNNISANGIDVTAGYVIVPSVINMTTNKRKILIQCYIYIYNSPGSHLVPFTVFMYNVETGYINSAYNATIDNMYFKPRFGLKSIRYSIETPEIIIPNLMISRPYKGSGATNCGVGITYNFTFVYNLNNSFAIIPTITPIITAPIAFTYYYCTNSIDIS